MLAGLLWQMLRFQDNSLGAKRDRACKRLSLKITSLCPSLSHSVRLSKFAASQAALPPETAADNCALSFFALFLVGSPQPL